MELQKKKKHPRELGSGHHEAESTAHYLLKVYSCELGNRRRFTDGFYLQRTRKRKESKASVKHAKVEGSEVREPVKVYMTDFFLFAR